MEPITFNNLREALARGEHEQEPAHGDWRKQRDRDVEERLRGRAERQRLKPMTKGHERYMNAIETSVITLCTGPAGTGKTYIATALALQLLSEGKADRVILTRPLVTCSGAGKGVGFLKGDLMEKITPYMRPMLDVVGSLVDARELEKFVRDGTIELVPLDMMRGLSLDRTVIVADEMQNAAKEQFRMLLTRFGRDSRVIVSGDATQTDLPAGGTNPLLDAFHRLSGNPSISRVYLTRADIVRHPLIQWIDEQYSAPDGGDRSDETTIRNETWYALRCPCCDAKVWWNNGDERDETHPDVDVVSCWQCREFICVDDEATANEVNDGDVCYHGIRVPGN